jgi:hypothetical protein
MTRRAPILFLTLGIVALAAAVWILMSLPIGEISYTDESVDIELIAPAGS